MLWFVIWVGCVVAAWAIGNSKSSPGGGLLLGIFLGPIGVLAAFALVDNKRAKCPHCRELIDKEATKCPKCQSSLEANWAAKEAGR
jgi:hypothetical protein